MGTTIEIVSGDWDLVHCYAVQDAIAYVCERRPERMVLDLSGLSFIDTSCLHSVVELRDGCEKRNIRLVIIPRRRDVHRLFEIRGRLDSMPFVGRQP